MTEVECVPGYELIGIDGCPAGWVLATSDPELRSIEFSILSTVTELIASADDGERTVAIDMPMGLAEHTIRTCDVEARRLLRAPRNSSVFPPPCRPALHAPTYLEACAA